MSRPFTIKVIAIGVLVLFAITVVWLLSRVDTKKEFETVASQATGLEVTVKGKVAIRLLPKLHATLNDIHMRNREMEIASVGDAEVGVELLPLLHKEVRIKRIALKDVDLDLERYRSGRLNAVTRPKEEKPMRAMSFASVSLHNVNFHYTNDKMEKQIIATGCTLESNDMQLNAGSNKNIMKLLSLTARGSCKDIRNDRFIGNDVNFSVAGRDGVLKFAPLTMHILGGKGSGDLIADFTGEKPFYKLHYAVARLELNELFKSVAPTKAGKGLLDFTADLNMRGTNGEELKRSADGQATLKGSDLQLAIGNLDEKLKHYDSSQNFNLVDVGAFFIAGPLGTMLTKGYDFASVFQDTDGDTPVKTFVSQWQVERGVAHARDVAMATPENRLAMTGALNFPNKSFDDVTVAILDDTDCARVEQRIRGPFAKPEIEKPNVLKSLAGPISRVVTKVKELAGKKCDVFYTGSLSHAKQ